MNNYKNIYFTYYNINKITKKKYHIKFINDPNISLRLNVVNLSQ